MNFRDFNRSVQIRIILKFVTVITNTAVLPFIVLYFANEIGSVKITILAIGIGVITLFGGLLGGQLADLKGRKLTIVIGESMTAVGFMLLLLGQILNEYMILLSVVAFILTNFFTAMALPGYSALILDETTRENRKSVYIYSMWTSYLGFAIGSSIGGLLFAGYKILLFTFIIISSIITVIVIMKWIPETLHKATQETSLSIKEDEGHSINNSIWKVVWNNKILLLLLFLGFVFSLMDQQIGYYLSLHYYDLFGEDSYSLLGFLRTENTVIAVVFLLVVKKLFVRFNEMNVALTGGVLLFVGYILLSMLQTQPQLFSAMFLAAVGEILLFPALQGISANFIPASFRGRYSSLANNVGMLGGMFAVTFMLLHPLGLPLIVTLSYLIVGILTLLSLSILKIKVEKIQQEEYA
ncbi:MFS transporter [Solibacillus sp. FSL W8-0372]|uniref:MFS transporter n=1 Tax=Solibacillus sp. FSL W8-0372 TaxID=2921713 RepID=UPI0030D29626